MRLKTLRKDRPIFEIEGAVINGNRIDLTSHLTKSFTHRSNTAFALPTSLHLDSSPLIVSSSLDQTHSMSARSYPQNHPSYQALETAYREQGIRIRLTSSRTDQHQSEKKSKDNLRRHSAFINRNPSRTSSVLHYTTTTPATAADLSQQHNSRPFSALQQTSSNDFEHNHTHNVSYAQSSQIDEEIYPTNFISPSIIESEHSICSPAPPSFPPPSSSSLHHLPDKFSLTTLNVVSTTTTPTVNENDPDFAYMCALLSKPSGDSFRETIRQRAGLRDTFAVHRHSLSVNSTHLSKPQIREKSASMLNRKDITRMESFTVLPTPSTKKIDKDIIKHASRIRRISSSKEQINKLQRDDSAKIKRNATDKSMKSISLEPLEYILSPKPRSVSLSTQDLPSTKSRHKKSSKKHTQTTKTSNILSAFSNDHLTTSTILNDESLALMRTSPIDITRQSNSFDSGCYDHSSSGDLQSLTSSSIVQIPSSIPSARLNCSAARRPNSNKRVSFYEEPSAVILTTATYV